MLRSITAVVAALTVAAAAAAQPVAAAPAGDATAIDAQPAPDPTVAPRCAVFDVRVDESTIAASLFPGGFASALDGHIALETRANVPAPSAAAVGVRVRQAYLVAQDWRPDQPAVLADPQPITLSPYHDSIGWWNRSTGFISLTLWLDSPNGFPAPMPVRMTGWLSGGWLIISGDNGNIPDATVSLWVIAHKQKRANGLTYSTETGFTIIPDPTTPALASVSDGDLLSATRCRLATNNELTARFGFQPIVPDLGLDALTHGDYIPRLFSLEEGNYSETMSQWISDGDLLADDGRVVRTNAQLIDAFQPVLSGTDPDVGLDAVHVGRDTSTYDGILFSTEDGFYSATMNAFVSGGDLLREDGAIFMTNAQLLQFFRRVCPVNGCPDLGLDAVYVKPTFGTEIVPEVWFSTEQGFHDLDWGWVSDGDLLSSRGYVVRRNLSILNACGPLEDLDNFGLDAVDASRVHCRDSAVSPADH